MDRLELVFPPEKLGGLLRQVVRTSVQCLGSRELGAKPLVDHLIEVLGLGEVLETVHPEVAQLNAGRQVPGGGGRA